MKKFIELNHGIVEIDKIIGISDPFFQLADVIPKKSKKTKPISMGLTKKKTIRMYGFNVLLAPSSSVTVIPTSKPYVSSSNTKKYTLQKHKELKDLLLQCEKE